MPDDRLALEISYLRGAADGIRIAPEAMDMDGVGARFGRAADALEAVMKRHYPVRAAPFCVICAEPFPCNEVQDITRALTGEEKTGG